MSDLAQFLLDRITEDEQAATAVSTRPPWTVGEDYKTWIIWSKDHGALCMNIWEEDANHVVRWNPDRVVAEIAAKRRIIALHESIEGDPYGEIKDRLVFWCAQCDHDRDYVGIPHEEDGCATLRLLAEPYKSHPGFDASWLLEETT